MSDLLPTGHKKIEEMRMEGIVKRFPGVLANDHVNFDVKAGEIHALLGENGAGKSTLVRQLYGLYRPDEGKIFINGEEVIFHSPKDSIAAGIGMIHQHFMLVPDLTVVENVALGLPSSRGVILDLDLVRKRIDTLCQQYNLKVDPDAYIWQLSVGEQQRVEILKALYRGAALLVLDEPTAVLTPQESIELFHTLKILKNEGKTIIFISHKLYEVLEISDRIVVLRNGKVSGERDPKNTDKRDLARLMVGKDVFDVISLSESSEGELIFELKNISAYSSRGHLALKNINLFVRKGEIVGIAGVSGNGQKELEEVISGIRKPIKGQIFYKNFDITNKSPKDRIILGIGRIPEDRMDHGLILDLPLFENLVIECYDKLDFSGKLFLKYDKIFDFSNKLVNEFDIRTPNLEVRTRNLSGGNLQKCILARILSMNPEFVLAAQPTRGLDVGATEYIHKKLLELRDKGCGILLISEDLDEILNLSDRLLVIYNGEIMGEVKRRELTKEEIGLMMAGTKKEEIHAIS